MADYAKYLIIPLKQPDQHPGWLSLTPKLILLLWIFDFIKYIL